MKVSVFGAGYVGLVTAACLADLGHTVVCMDVDADKVARIQAGEAPIFEPGLEDLIRKGQADGRFSATSSPHEAFDGSEVSMIAVGTPDRDGRIDLHHVMQIAGTLGDFIRESSSFHTVIVKSTVIPGTTVGPVREELEHRSGKQAGADFGLGMNPEFLREGSAVQDFGDPDRVVVGALDSRTAEVMLDLYRRFDCPKLVVLPTEAECIKYTANGLLSTLISFSNEIFNVCESMPGVSGRRVLEAVLADRRWTPRVGGKLLKPGIQSYVMGGVGYGGSCFPKDMNALVAMAHDRGWKVPLLDAVIEVNTLRPVAIVARLSEESVGLRNRKVAVLGLAFKPGTDDWRNSPSLPLVQTLLEEGAQVVAWDPLVSPDSVAQWHGRVDLVRDPLVALKGAHAALITTAWPEISQWPWLDLLPHMARPLIYDGRNLLGDVSWPADVRYVPAGSGRMPGEA